MDDYCNEHGHELNDEGGYRCWECDAEVIQQLSADLRKAHKELDKINLSTGAY